LYLKYTRIQIVWHHLKNFHTSRDTSDYVCDSIKIWWNTIGKKRFPNATSILILADGGGRNGSWHHIFKESLQNLANKLGLELRMATLSAIYIKMESN
jgi:hypothetical protein